MKKLHGVGKMIMADDDHSDIKDDLEDKESDQKDNKDLQIDNLKEEVKGLEEKWKRALADYQNLERRTQDLKREWAVSSSKDVVAKLLPVLDTLLLAQSHLKDEGLRLSIQKFLDVLKDEGVTRIETEGKQFDPNLMEAIEVIEGPKEKVVGEVRPGFMLCGKVLRPAQVTVGKGK